MRGENISRFKFVIIADGIKGKERETIKENIRMNGIIRLLETQGNFNAGMFIKWSEEELPKKYKDDKIGLSGPISLHSSFTR